ncbi:TIMELESS-interacting protein [Nilaparvata lugens]|uniref:TIMELESS-interacting protein n=1 Tax=Nilaparvata lugens TaxID=108931 RepID=UPI00193E667D|nr:TIMELESS-interacting protein [Nilaparvata lugens]
MALLHNDLFSNEAVDDPEDLDLLVEGRGQEDNETAEQATGDNSDKEEKKDDQPEKKKRKQSQRPRLNILRLMDNNTGLLAAERMFKDVKFKGKGHELEDLNLIMKKMEIWAHKLYPSFDFDDCLAKLEKLGNTRSVATYVKKLRMGLEDDIVTPQHDDEDVNENTNNDNTEENQPPPRANSPGRFDQLVRNQPQNEPAQGGLTEEQRERMRKNRLIAEQRRAARMKELREKQQRMAAGNAVLSQSPFQTTSDDNTPIIAHSQQNNSSELQNTLNAECDSTNISQTEKEVSVNNSTQIGENTQDKDEIGETTLDEDKIGHGDNEVPMNISTEIGETTKHQQKNNDVTMNINS